MQDVEQEATLFFLIRHGHHNLADVEAHRFIGLGLELSPLTEQGKEQAVQCAKDKRLRDCDIIVTSPYTRAMQTASILSKELLLDLQVEIDLREVDFDLSYSARNFDELMGSRNKPESRETPESAKCRVLRVLAKYAKYRRVIVVTHGDVICSLTEDRKIGNCEIVEYRL